MELFGFVTLLVVLFSVSILISNALQNMQSEINRLRFDIGQLKTELHALRAETRNIRN